MNTIINRAIEVPAGSPMTADAYASFLKTAYGLISGCPQYMGGGEDINSLELAHLYPPAAETVLAVYTGINDAVCNKALVTPFLIRHGHNNVFAFDPAVYAGGEAVPPGTIDACAVLAGFSPPNDTWKRDWTYVMIADPALTPQSLWRETGYVDMVPAKFEDFTLCSDPARSRVCFYIDPVAFSHPVNQSRGYLKAARRRGDAQAGAFGVPSALAGETDGLAPVVLGQGEKLYVARPDFAPCAHAWSNLHPDNEAWAVVNENSAVPLDLVLEKPPLNPRYAKGLVPPRGSADMTTDWFLRGRAVHRAPLLQGQVQG